MEESTADTNGEVSCVCNGKDGVMSISVAAQKTLHSKQNEHHIRQGVGELGGVDSRIVVLPTIT